jgi:hypothetical protein
LLSCKQKCVELEGKNFIKLAKDTKLLSKALTTTDIDLIFAKVGSRAAALLPPSRRTGPLMEPWILPATEAATHGLKK